MASTAHCEQCNRDITDRDSIVKAIRNYGKGQCKVCKTKLDVTVSADDVLLLPEPYQTDALCAFTE